MNPIILINNINNNKRNTVTRINDTNSITKKSLKTEHIPNKTRVKKGRAARKRSKKNQRLIQTYQSYINKNSNNIFKLNQRDDTIIMRQLGFIPHHVVEISSRMSNFPSFPRIVRKIMFGNVEIFRKNNYGDRDIDDSWMQPTTIKLYPLSPKPFPTIYWLTHRLLSSYVGKMEESRGCNVKIMEEYLQKDETSREKLKKAHELYIKERMNMFSEIDLKLVKEKNWIESLGSSTGIGGIRNWNTIKCLHLHVAQYLVWYKRWKEGKDGYDEENENVVGRWVLEGIERWLEKNDE